MSTCGKHTRLSLEYKCSAEKAASGDGACLFDPRPTVYDRHGARAQFWQVGSTEDPHPLGCWIGLTTADGRATNQPAVPHARLRAAPGD